MNHSTTQILKNLASVSIGLVILMVIGAVGYVVIEGWNIFDALYMTFISISTVGFGEIGKLQPVGRLFTMVIILFGLLLLSMLSASVTSFWVSRELLPAFKKPRMKKRIFELQNHTILCGAGATGETIITEFLSAGKPLVVIDKESETLERLGEMYPNFLVVMGDATKDESLMEANILKASSLITVLSEDADNLFVVISARSINPQMSIIARAVDSHSMGKMYRAGATHVISSNVTEGLRMAAVVLRPTVVNFLDVMISDDETAYRLEELTVPVGSKYHGKKLSEAEIPQKTGLIVIAIEKSESTQRMIYNPQSSTVIEERDKFVVLGNTKGIEKLDMLLRA